MLLWTTSLFVVVELTTGQVIEPWLYGHSTGLSGIAVVVAAAFREVLRRQRDLERAWDPDNCDALGCGAGC